MARGEMLIRIFVLKVINIEKKFLTHHATIDSMTEQIESVIIQVCKKSELWAHPNLQQTTFSLTFSFKLTYICIVDIWNFKEIRNHSQPLKLQQNIKNCHKFT